MKEIILKVAPRLSRREARRKKHHRGEIGQGKDGGDVKIPNNLAWFFSSPNSSDEDNCESSDEEDWGLGKDVSVSPEMMQPTEYDLSAKEGQISVKPLSNIKHDVKENILPRRKHDSTVTSCEVMAVDDCHIHCEECEMLYLDNCNLHPLVDMPDSRVAVGVVDRARLTLPPGLSLSDSKIKGAGKGVWTDTKISKFTRFGPYEGVTRLCNVKTDMMTAYEWLVTGEQTHYIDGEDTTIANWLRYVNCARSKTEQNLKAFQYRGKIYYKTLTYIPIGHELLVWYGDDYSLDLDANQIGHSRLSSSGDESQYATRLDKESRPKTVLATQELSIDLSRSDHQKTTLDSQGGDSRLDLETSKVDCARAALSQGADSKLDAGTGQGGCLIATSTVQDDSELDLKRGENARPATATVQGNGSELDTGHDKVADCQRNPTITLNNSELITEVIKSDCPVPTLPTQDDSELDLGLGKAGCPATTATEGTDSKLDIGPVKGNFLGATLTTQDNSGLSTGLNNGDCSTTTQPNQGGDSKQGSDHMEGNHPTSVQDKCSSSSQRVKYSCSECHAKFFHRASISAHLKWHKKSAKDSANMHQPKDASKQLKPGDCDLNCDHQSQQEKHLRLQAMADKSFACVLCDYTCSYSTHLDIHLKTHSRDEPLECTQCGYKCARASHLEAHMRTHVSEKTYACTECNYKSVRSHNLRVHLRTHSNRKPFACSQCEYRCRSLGNLQIHMRSHTGDRPFACTECDFKCKTSSHLRAHMRTHTGEKPYKCTLCDFRCAVASHIPIHMRIHTGEKPFACTYCDYRSSAANCLKIHMRTHTGEKPFACTQCNYKSSSKTGLIAHKRTHTGEKPFACTQCDYKSSQASNLRSHIDRIHNI